MKQKISSRIAIFLSIFIASCQCESIILGLTRPVNASTIQYNQHDIYIDGLRIRYIDEGSGPTMLLIHGHQSRIEEFSIILPSLVNDFRVLAFDMPGSGYSEKPDIKYSLKMYDRFVLKFLDKMEIDKTIIVGGSMGANIALRLSRNNPNRVSKLVIWSPAGVWEKHHLLAWLAGNLYNTQLHCIVLSLQSAYWYADSFSGKDAALKDVFNYIHEVDSVGFRAATADIASQQLLDIHLGKGHLNKHPILMLVGELDGGLDLVNKAKDFAKELPNIRFKVIKNTGHSILSERPKIFERYLREFLIGGGQDKLARCKAI